MKSTKTSGLPHKMHVHRFASIVFLLERRALWSRDKVEARPRLARLRSNRRRELVSEQPLVGIFAFGKVQTNSTNNHSSY